MPELYKLIGNAAILSFRNTRLIFSLILFLKDGSKYDKHGKRYTSLLLLEPSLASHSLLDLGPRLLAAMLEAPPSLKLSSFFLIRNHFVLDRQICMIYCV